MKKSIVRREMDLSTLELADSTHPILKRVYAARGVSQQKDILRELKGLVPASELMGIEAAVDLLVDAIRNQKRILIVGDFDVDGATSSVLGVLALRAMGAEQVSYLVPNRFEYGYGLTPEIVEAAVSHSPAGAPELLITVDNGIASLDGVELAKPIQLAYSTGDIIDTGVIKGRVYSTQPAAVYLFNEDNSDSLLVSKPD